MNTEKFCHFLRPLAETADEMPPARHQELLQLLQQGFIAAFKEAGDASGPGSREEAKLTITGAVRAFHEKAPATNSSFFTSPSYHPQAALFLQELLQSLAGNSKAWFRELQLLSMKTCLSILACIGWRNVRQCLPGVVSGTVRYINRSHLGKDSAAVRHGALRVLQRALEVAFSTNEDAAWVQEAVTHLSATMRGLLAPKSLVESDYDAISLDHMRRLVATALGSKAMIEHKCSGFAHLLLVAHMVMENMHHLSPAVAGGHASDAHAEASPATPLASRPLTLDLALLTSEDAAQTLRESVTELRGVELLHLVTSLVRLRATRSIIVAKGNQSTQLFLSIVKKCVRAVGTQMSPEDLYTARAPRRFPAGVVDECLECLAHALAVLPSDVVETGDEDDIETPGEVLTNALLDSCEAALDEWELYMIHPSLLYVLTRLVTWQFKPLPPSLIADFDNGELPLASDFTESGTLEQLWSVVARPHLWDITRDEALCSYQQIHHRQMVAAVILRFLSVAATDVLAPAVRSDANGGNRGRRSFMRVITVTLYLVMEKAATTGLVHESAMSCVRQLFAASDRSNALDFFLDAGVHLIDDASRAVKETYLRPAAASVLRGAVAFAVSALGRNQGGKEEGTRSAASMVHDTSQLPLLVRHRTSPIEVDALQRACQGVTVHDIDRLADFAAATVQVACDCCRLATEEGDEHGTKAALALLKDTLDIAAALNFCSPLEANDEEGERQTTSFNERVRLLQEEVCRAVLLVLSHCFTASLPGVASGAVQVVVRGLLDFLTTKAAESWSQDQIMAWNDAQTQKRKERREAEEKRRERRGGCTPLFPLKGSNSEDDSEHEGAGEQVPKLVSPALPWNVAGADVGIVLQRSHLKTVYRAYLCFVALLKEPIARFVSKASRPGHRKAEERRQMEELAVTPSLFAALGGLEALVLLTTDFLEHRMGSEVLSLALVWYEKGALPRIPTNTDERVKQAVRQFAVALVQVSSTSRLRNAVRERCKPFFFISDPESETVETANLAFEAPESAIIHTDTRSVLEHDPAVECKGSSLDP